VGLVSSAVPAIPFFGDAYLADTRHLSLEEHGAYLQLIMIAWRIEGCCLPDDDARLARMLGTTAAKWRKLKPTVMAFWTLENGAWKQARLTKERNYVESRRQAQRDKAASKWESSPEEDGLSAARKRAARLTEARAKGRHTAAEWEELVRLTGSQCVKCHASGCELVKDHILPIYRGGSDALNNLQPLCVSCNSSKSADDTDYRLSVCKDLFERLPNACRTTAPPPLPPKEEVESSNDDSPSSDEPSLRPEHVFESYRKLAASIGRPVPRDFTAERRQLARGRITQRGLDDFQTVFAKCRDSPFLRGDNGRTPLTFDWLMKKGNFQKVLEGNYDS
jgi:uncharacterized protein YdaU (DUF1376 family)